MAARTNTMADLAARQHGVVCASQLRQLDISRDAVATMVTNGTVHPVHPRVYAVGHPALCREGRWMAAVLAGGTGAVLSHVAAAQLWGLTRSDSSRVDITLARAHRALAGVGVHRSRTLVDADMTIRDHVPATTVARTIVDLGDVCSAARLAHVMHEADFHSVLDLSLLLECMERNRGRRRIGIVQQAVEMHTAGSAGARSSAEEHMVLLVTAAGLAKPRVGARVRVPGGSLEVDLLWEEESICVEIDGPGHRRPRTRREDAARDALLRSAGYRVLRVTTDEVFHQPDDSVARIRHLLASGGRAGRSTIVAPRVETAEPIYVRRA